MALFAHIGVVTRALPTEEGVEIKLQCESGSHILDVPANRPELVEAARLARMSGETMLVRRTETGMVVALQSNVVVAAA